MLVIFDDRDPPWINDPVANQIKQKNKIYEDYFKNGRTKKLLF